MHFCKMIWKHNPSLKLPTNGWQELFSLLALNLYLSSIHPAYPLHTFNCTLQLETNVILVSKPNVKKWIGGNNVQNQELNYEIRFRV